MEKILRSLIQVGGHPDTEEAYNNWLVLQDYSLEFRDEEDQRIFSYLKDFYGQMSAPPDFPIIRDFFEKQDDIEAVNRLEDVSKSQFHIRQNFLAIVRSEQEQQQIKELVILCRDASAIAEHGRTDVDPRGGKVTRRGVRDAVNYMFDHLHDFVRIEGGEKLEGVITEDAEEVLDEYDKTEQTDKFAGRNLFGLEPVDAVCRGHRRGEFWVHTAFVSELKTTLALNYAYNNVMVYGKNIFYAILEMPYKQLRRQLYLIHSSHGKFVTEWHKEDGYVGLDYRSVRDGELSPRDRERLSIVAQDFKESARGKLYVWRPNDDVTVQDIRHKAEMFDNKYGCDGIVLDHMGLIKPRKGFRDTVSSLNDIVRESRLMALNFARGKTVPVLGLFQMNRQGKLRADKADGRYDIAAISYANEIEKSADVISYTYLNDHLRKEAQYYLGCLKNRDNPPFDRMIGKILWNSKRMRAIEQGMLDLDADHIVAASDAISVGMEEMYSYSAGGRAA